MDASSILSAAVGAVAGVISAVAVKRTRTETVTASEVVTKTVTFDANECFDQINRLEKRINEIADQNRELRSENRELRERIAVLEVWVRSQGHDPDLISLTQLVRDGHIDLDKEI